ncbi:MAG: ROK family protein [Rhodospirillales bacterium]|nr:ROK family protein [Rhodospirillales bacterium]
MRIGIDLGGTKIDGIALADDGRILAHVRVPTPAGDYGRTVAALVDIVARLERDAGETGSIGIGIPGALSPATGLVKNSNSTALNGKPLDRDLETALGRPVRLANDANCFTLSEATDGTGKGAATVFGVILGTGVGGGIVIDGKLLTGRNAIAGEWGHNPLPNPRPDELPGPRCYCGRMGCIESFLSGPSLAADYRRAGGSSEAATAERIVEQAAAGEPKASAALDRYEDRLARALASIVNVLDPDVIVLGGGLSNVERLYAAVPKLWTPYVFSDRIDTDLRRAVHGDSSGRRGAAWLWPTKARS